MITSLVYLVIYILVIGLICWLLLYAIDAVGLPEPFHKVARALIIVVGVLIVILLLLQMLGAAGLPKLGGLYEIYPHVAGVPAVPGHASPLWPV